MATLKTRRAHTTRTLTSVVAPTTPERWNSIRVGVDVVTIRDVQVALDRFGARYTTRVFTARELTSSGGPDSPTLAAGLAARFAAKEAVIKVLRPVDISPRWKSIEVVRHDGGWCSVVLRREAARMAEEAGIEDVALSLSHDRGVAFATAVAQVCPR